MPENKSVITQKHQGIKEGAGKWRQQRSQMAREARQGVVEKGQNREIALIFI